MHGDNSSRTGLRPTLRQMMIVILWFALLSAAVRTLLGLHVLGFRVDFDCIMIPLLVNAFGLPLLAVLLWFLDTRGPVQAWHRACYMAGASVVGGVSFLLQDPVCFVLTGSPTITFPMSPFIAAVCLLSGAFQLRSNWPRPCLRCGRRAVIAVSRPARVKSRRLINTGNDGWCAICGATYARKGAAAWQPKAL